jgi:hypothetical protein
MQCLFDAVVSKHHRIPGLSFPCRWCVRPILMPVRPIQMRARTQWCSDQRQHRSKASVAPVPGRLCMCVSSSMLCYAMCVNRAQVALAYTPKPPELVFDIELISFRCIVCTCGCYKSLLYRQQLLFKKQTLNLLPYN